MQGRKCESLPKKPGFLVRCGCLFDEKTRARLERENEETWKGLLSLKERRRIRKKEELVLQQEDEHKEEKETREDETHLVEKSKKDYRFTKWSKLKILRQKKENKKWQEYLTRHKNWIFCAALIKLKVSLSRQEWQRTCHLKERAIIRKNIHLENILKIRWKYKIDEALSSDSIIFDKIMKHERERKKQLRLRQERLIKIITKIAQEMNNGIRLWKKPKDVCLKKTKLKEISRGSLSEIFFEEIQGEESLIAEKTVPEDSEKDRKVEDSELKLEEDKKDVEAKKDAEAKKEGHPLENEGDFEKFVVKESKSSIEQVFEQDTCFFAIPSIVTFDNFEANKKYSRKVIVRNKAAKWAYLRFHKVYTEVWEPAVIEIDIMDAARVKPGLDVIVNVKFSPVHEEEVTAEISFLTLSPDYPETFHEFRVPVRCTPQTATPVLEPTEVRFPSAPIWRYDNAKFNERTLIISNDGSKSFSIVIEERNDRDHCFLWHFDQADIQSVKSSISCFNKEETEQTSVENTDDNKDVSVNQKSGKMYQIEVPPKFKCRLKINFRPRYIGLHHEVLEICFLTENRTLGKLSVPIWTEVIGYQIHLDPPCIDLGIVMIDSDVCQQSFTIVNNGRNSVEVLTKTPKNLGNQVSVYPKSTIVQSESSSKVNVRFIPESSIIDTSARFYDPMSNMLEFPIQVQIMSQGPRKPPPLILKALASLTTCNGLILEPPYVELGYVHTHESVYTELTLTNESLFIQEYAFVDLPPSMEIHPNHGFGAVLPGETIKLHLIYSACLTDIPGNEIGENGLTGERSFQVQVVTLAELAGCKRQTILNKLKNEINTRSTVPRNRGLPPPVPMNLKTPKVIRRMTDRDEDNLEDQLSNDSVMNEKDPDDKKEVTDPTIEKSYRLDKRKEKNSIEIYVYIIDTFCELSEQIIEFPPTPCGSFSMASVHLRGFNVASYPHCTCGIIKNQRKEFTARYQFKSSSDRLKIMPQSGVLQSNEFIAVNFMFKPRLPKNMIFEKDLRLKMNVDEQETKTEKIDESAKEARRKKRKKEVEEKKVPEVDKVTGEIGLLETFERCISTIFVTCTIDLEMKDGTKRDELLFVKLICSISRPEILVLNEDREIAFGPTAIGTSSRKFLFVKNISNQNVKIDVSLLDPFGPFFVPPGRTIETGSILKLPVTYQPEENHEDENQEYFEVSSSRTRTRWRVKLTGRGVVPSYVLKPRFRVARFELTDEKSIELRMSIQNTGSCPLIFRLSLMDVLEGDIPRPRDKSPQRSSIKRRKGKAESGKSAKAEFDDNLLPNEELAIFGGNLKRSEDRSSFSFWNVDENMQLLVLERKTVEFGVRFQPVSEGKDSGAKESTKATPRVKKKANAKKNADKQKETNYCHVAIVKLTLGSSTLLDFIIIFKKFRNASRDTLKNNSYTL